MGSEALRLVFDVGRLRRMTAPAKRPPAERGQGRKSLQGAGMSPVLQVRLTTEQKEKVTRLGGAPWVRKMIDKAKEVPNGNDGL